MVSLRLALVVLSCLLLREVVSAPASAQIVSLPGLNTKLAWQQYGGYITVDESAGRNLFYWFVESQGNPSKDPLFLWLQGGPGCSSLFGFLTEHGPFLISEKQEVLLNPWSWNTNASIIYLESLAGVGFSFTGSKVNENGDNKTMHDSYVFLQKWFQLYPEYKSNDFYVSGESYGGHYVPQLAWTILQGNKNSSNAKINLKGLLVGNPWTDNTIDTWSIPPFIFYHHLCSLPTYEAVVKACILNSSIDTHSPFVDHRPRRVRGTVDKCDAALDQMYEEVGNNTNQYDIYAPCLVGAGLDCSDYTAETNFLNNPAVQAAIHAKKPAQPWEVCADVNFTESWDTVLGIYPELMNAIHVTAYAGDVTFNVPALGTEIWVEGFGRKVVSPYQAWNVEGQVAGYYKKFDGITFVTVKDSGHMVPTFTPVQGKVLLNEYLAGKF